jgi:hypothetical protein
VAQCSKFVQYHRNDLHRFGGLNEFIERHAQSFSDTVALEDDVGAGGQPVLVVPAAKKGQEALKVNVATWKSEHFVKFVQDFTVA